MNNTQGLGLRQVQKQTQRLSQVQITALNYLSMSNETLRDEIYRAVSNNPALEIIKEPIIASFGGRDSYTSFYSNSAASDKFQQIIENQESYGESLQTHLLHQLN